MQSDIEHNKPLKSIENRHPLSDYGRQNRQKLSPTRWHLILILGDDALFLVVLALVLLLIPHLASKPPASKHELHPQHLRMLWGSLALISWSIAVRITRTQDLPQASNLLSSPLSVLFALVLMGICWRVLTYPLLTGGPVYPRVLLFFLTLAIPIFSVWRVALAIAINLPRFRRQAVIIGTNTAAKTIAKALQGTKYPIAHALGYISEAPIMEVHDRELPVLGDKHALRHLTQNGIIDMIIMAIDYKANPELFQEAIEATQLGISLVPMALAYERSQSKIPVEHVGDQWYLALPIEVRASACYLCWHTVMDTLFGLLGMLILGLIFPFMALLIRLDSAGPIFYTQERLGHHGRKFHIRKFRSMYHNAEQPGKAVWAIESDTRITRVGYFLRSTHLDELPQAFNILRGEMSLIGPRPERQEFVSELEKMIPFYRCRLMVKPGLTGWAQVKHHYGNTTEDALEKLQYDLYYIKHQSFTLDILILLKTVAEVVFCGGT